MTNPTEPTSRPWSLGDELVHQGILQLPIFSESAGGMWNGGYVGTLTVPNAALIVKAVNAFDFPDAGEREVASDVREGVADAELASSSRADANRVSGGHDSRSRRASRSC